MNKILVWDLPARLFHWAFAGSLTASLGIGLLLDQDHPLFQQHKLFGIAALFFLALRIGMGLVGSRYSRFASFPVHPREVIGYLVSAVLTKTKLYAGNNPGSASAAVLMFLLVPALFVSGIYFGNEDLEELHETFAWSLLAVTVMHLLGLAWHTIRHRENISMAMVTGRKPGKPEDAIASAHAAWGIVMLAGAGFWIAALFASYDAEAATVRLPVTRISLHLGDKETSEEHGGDHDKRAGKRNQGRDDD